MRNIQEEFKKMFHKGLYGKASIEVDGERIVSYGGQAVYTQDVKNFISKVCQEIAREMILPNIETEPKEWQAVDRYRRSQKRILNYLTQKNEKKPKRKTLSTIKRWTTSLHR